MDYAEFLKNFDEKLDLYFSKYKGYVFCCEGCSSCCEKGDYPLSELELKYIMQGFSRLDYETRIEIQKNLKVMKKGEACPFLVSKKCAIYPFRPIVCRVHGLAYLTKGGTAKLPHCVRKGKNFNSVYHNKMLEIEPVKENLDTPSVLKDFDFGEIRNLADWFKSKSLISFKKQTQLLTPQVK